MGLNDEMEKLRQAEQWMSTGNQQDDRVTAAFEHVIYVHEHSADPALRAEAARILAEWECPYGCAPMDHGC